MTRETGAALLELLVASAIMLAATGAVFTLVADATARSPQWNDAADLHQRGRVAAATIARVIGAAAASVPHLSGTEAFPAIEPRRRSTFTASTSALTTRHVPDGAAWARTTAPLAPGDASAAIALHAGCPAVPACGFSAGTHAVVLDGAAGWHLLTIVGVGPDVLAITDRVPGRTATFPAGSTIAEVEETSLYFDAREGTLRQQGPGDGDFPVVDGMARVHFEYFVHAGEPIPLSAFADGPLCGSGSLAYDCDLRRIRTIRATLTIASPRPTTADLTVVLDVSPRNLQR